jgi:tetratricopeptide (TPR) repeat protein
LDFAEPDEHALALYASANEKFESCSRNLVFCAPEIIDEYDQALKAGPRSSQAPLAIYRTALALFIMGNYAKANSLFRQVTFDWPDHPVATRCWIGIGEIYNKKQSYLEAMEAFRSAQRSAVETEDKAAACYQLGRVFLILGANKEALEMLNNCIGLDPDYYLKKPDVFRFIGEALFGLGNFEKAKEHLLRYVNYQQSAPDQDIILAKISEIFLTQGDLSAAGKMYSFIQKYYTDSEGDLICRVRQGELTENLDEAIKIYDDLCGKDLSPSLRRIVLMKLALLNLKKGDLAQSLKMLDDAFPARNAGDSSSEQGALREKILCELVGRYFSDKDFTGIVQLHDKYRRVFDSLQAPAVLEQIAESYASLKFYSVALSIYDKVFAKGQKKEEDLLRCAFYALRLNDSNKSSQFCKAVQSEAMDMKKSEILGHIFYRDQKYADALKSFGKVLQKGKDFELDDPDSWVAYGDSLYQTSKFDEAIPAFQKAMERVKGDDTDARLSIIGKLVKCFVEQKQYPKAAEMMEVAKQSAGEDRKNELLYDISKLYIASGQIDKAVENLNQLKSTEQPFWAAIAEQQLNTIDMGRTNAIP